MDEIRSILRTAARRLELSALVGKTHLVTVILGLAVIGLLVAERLGAATFVPWSWVLPVAVAVGLVVAARWWHAGRRSELQVAVEVDERLDLREKLSTALHCRDRSDPFARAAVEDAVGAARDPRVREQVRRLFPLTSPRRWWLSPLVVLGAVAVAFVPPLDLFAPDDDANAMMASAVQERDQAIEAVIKPIEQNPQLRDQLTDLLGELTTEGTDPDALKSREDVRRDAIKKLTDLNKRLDEIVNGPKGKTAESIDRAFERLRTPQEGPAQALAEALAAGDLKAAQEALAKLQAEAQPGQMDDEQRRQLAQQLNDLARQLNELAQQQQQLEDLLKQAGLNPQLAGNPQALQQAIQDDPNLNQQQKQQLQQMAQAQQAAARALQGLGQGLGQMAQEVAAGQLGPAGQQVGEQLSQLEAMRQMLQQAQAAANACQGQTQGLGQGLVMQQAIQQWMQSRGGAFGDRGHGAGGEAPINPTPTGHRIVKSPTKTTQGDIIARQFVEGPQFVGESTAKLEQVATAVNQGFDEAQGDEQLPRKYWEAHMHYFGELKKLVEVVQEEESDEPADPAPSDEAEAGD
ncbi:MAG: hypothetical protein ACYS0G_05955 [Planctomycetota bacterium]|jgi:hypothetical protein